ncbi:ABC transporter permease subunit [Streptomyces sp. TRM66268-LWL]|uniref:ABC transporter permease subunit n=1 Tax=Streptomyces polyasparticus TaxID=2767826 RepID=A0ABR7S6Z3_9ACTN|nr:ABC transporter permease [Streptomyces polyasparticus]MBC9711246.1 ABC transporter permease subunit [Streptomyces polyasparticus]
MTYAPTAPPAELRPRARFRDVAAAEWIKTRSLRSTPIAYATTAFAVLAFNLGTAYDSVSHWSARNAADTAAFIGDGIPLQHAYNGNAALVLMLALGALGAFTIVGEYATGTIRTTFAAVPARSSVLGAKAAVLALVSTVFGLLLALASFYGTQAILGTKGAGIGLGDPGALRIVLASALLAPVSALAGLALGALIRHTATTMIAVVTVLLMLPIVLTDGRYLSALLGHALPYQAWLRLAEPHYVSPQFGWTQSGAWTVYAVWALVSAAVAVVSVRRRDQ